MVGFGPNERYGLQERLLSTRCQRIDTGRGAEIYRPRINVSKSSKLWLSIFLVRSRRRGVRLVLSMQMQASGARTTLPTVIRKTCGKEDADDHSQTWPSPCHRFVHCIRLKDKVAGMHNNPAVLSSLAAVSHKLCPRYLYTCKSGPPTLQTIAHSHDSPLKHKNCPLQTQLLDRWSDMKNDHSA